MLQYAYYIGNITVRVLYGKYGEPLSWSIEYAILRYHTEKL